jgi:hypothetical protein
MGRATWPRIPATCASARSLVHGGHGEGGADRGGPRHTERERTGARGNDLASGRAGPRGREGRGARGRKVTGADSSAPLGSERETEESTGQSGADRRGPPVRGDRRAGASARDWAWWAGLGQNGFSFFLNFLIIFPFLFSRVFNPNSIQVLNSN